MKEYTKTSLFGWPYCFHLAKQEKGFFFYTDVSTPSFVMRFFYVFSYPRQVSAWQSATLLPISCKSSQPVPAQVEEPFSLVRRFTSGGATNNPPFPEMP